MSKFGLGKYRRLTLPRKCLRLWSPSLPRTFQQASRFSGTIPEALGSFLSEDMIGRFSSSHARLAELVPFAAKVALECIGSSDALYHNIEHTMLVTLVGHEIFKGRVLVQPSTANDYANFIVACLTHDIGYVRGIVRGDGEMASSPMEMVASSSYRADRPTQHSRPIMSTAQKCLSWIGLKQSKISMRNVLRGRSNIRGFLTRRRLAIV